MLGDSHAEVRQLVQDFKMDVLKSEISVSEEEAIKLSKQSKKTPIIFNVKYKADPKVEQEAKINPLLVKPKPLDLPTPLK